MKQEGKWKIYLEDLTWENNVFSNNNKVQMIEKLKLKHSKKMLLIPICKLGYWEVPKL